MCNVHSFISVILTGKFDWQDNGLVTWALGCDFSGNDLLFDDKVVKTKSSAEVCGKICFDHPLCTHFSWGPESSCFLKSAVKPTAFSALNDEWICGWVNSRV